MNSVVSEIFVFVVSEMLGFEVQGVPINMGIERQLESRL